MVVNGWLLFKVVRFNGLCQVSVQGFLVED